eukprot:6185838-Pleurochrysis_carterae.AAC.1
MSKTDSYAKCSKHDLLKPRMSQPHRGMNRRRIKHQKGFDRASLCKWQVRREDNMEKTDGRQQNLRMNWDLPAPTPASS